MFQVPLAFIHVGHMIMEMFLDNTGFLPNDGFLVLYVVGMSTHIGRTSPRFPEMEHLSPTYLMVEVWASLCFSHFLGMKDGN